MTDPADVFVTAADGQEYWGRFGGAGVLIAAPTGRFLLQLRSAWTHSGGTWGIPGGAIRLGESPLEGALRELGEEVVMSIAAPDLVEENLWIADRGGWTYTTILMRAPAEFSVSPANNESDAIRWVSPAEMRRLPLHRGFAALWQEIEQELVLG